MGQAPLSPDDRQRLTRILAERPQFTDGGPRGRRVLLEQAGVFATLGSPDLSGSPSMVAGDVIGRLERYGPLPGQPDRLALDVLAAYLRGQEDLPGADGTYLAELVARLPAPGRLELPRTDIPATSSMTAGQRRRLTTELDGLQTKWDTLTRRIEALDTDIGRALSSLDKQIFEERRAEAVRERDKVGEEIDEIERRLGG
jgi:hypothetical protein